MRLGLVLGVVGSLLALWSLAFLAPIALALYDSGGDPRPAAGYILGGAASYVLGRLLSRLRADAPRFHRTEAMAVVAGTWAIVTLAAAVPFLWLGWPIEDAYFEAMSGLTTTGSSVLSRFDAYDRAFFFWRSELQWIGGLGVIALFVAILPRLGIAGRQLFFAEATGPTEEGLSPQIRRTAGRLWVLYTALTLAETALLIHYGMPAFDALCNSMATLSTGGFSPNPRSIEGYGLPACDWVIVVFMFLGGASFTLQYRVLTRQPFAFARDPEFRLYLVIAVVLTAALALVLAGGVPGTDHWRLAAFQVVSLQSTSGFANADFDLWSDGARALVMLAAVFGACAGSSGGGPKVVRYLLLWRHCGREIARELHPQAVVPVRLGREAVSDDIVRSVVMFVVVYFAVLAASALALILLGSDLVTSTTASLVCLANAGPGLGKVGPMANFEGLPAASKWVLSATMWVGRLGVITVLALFRREVVRHLRWR